MTSSVRRSGRLRGRLGIALLVVLAVIMTTRSASAQGEYVTVTLGPVDVPDITGTATLTAEGEATHVEMTLSGLEVTGDHPTHIHTGTCQNFDPNPTYPLTTVNLDPVDDQGASSTTVDDVSLEELTREDFVVLVHLSADELTTYLACGEIRGPTIVPATGVGAAARGRSGAAVVGMAAVAALGLAGFTLRRRAALS